MVLNYRKHQPNISKDILKDARGDFAQIQDKLRKKDNAFIVFFLAAAGAYLHPWFLQVIEVLTLFCLVYFWWLHKKPETLPFKMPKTSGQSDPNDKMPGSGKLRTAEGILYLGNDDATGEEIWFNNDDARTHILYLGTTGAGKSEGLKGFVTNAMGWGSGFIYIDGKADTDLWGSLSALARRYGRDDDLLVLNYMTGNSDKGSVSNSINPFALGSASYLTNLLVSLMPEGGGDNAMWKDRAVALMNVIMPVLTWKRDELEVPLSINTIREEMRLARIVTLSRDRNLPDGLRKSLHGYLLELPGYNDTYYNDDGSPRAAPNGQPHDTSTTDQQHGFLTMQFTKQLQSLGGDYGYIFLNPYADIDIMDVVLNRRILVALIPALEKSADEAANLGKIVASLLKGMMGATLGSTVEGDTSMALENKPTRAPTPFMAVFDEVGYYATQGMAVMAAQARSLGFSLVFAGQDLPALEKRIKEEARSITANCNIKIFGKLEDPTQTKEFFEKTVGKALVLESGGRKQVKTLLGSKVYEDSDQYSLQAREKADYDDLKGYLAGQAVVCFGDHLVKARMFFSNPGKIKSLRVNRFISLVHPDPQGKRGSRDVEAVQERFRDRNWTAESALSTQDSPSIIRELAEGFHIARHQEGRKLIEAGAYALTWMAFKEGHLKKEDVPDPQVEQAALKDAGSTAHSPAAHSPAALPADSPDRKINPTLNAANAAKKDAPPVMAAQPVAKPAAPTEDRAGTLNATRENPAKTTPSITPDETSATGLRARRNDDAAPAQKLASDTGSTANDPATAETVSWADFLKSEDDDATPVGTAPVETAPVATAAATADATDDEVLPEDQEAIEKGTKQTMSWAALLGEDEPVQPAPLPPGTTVGALTTTQSAPTTGFSYGGFGSYGNGISYAQPGSSVPNLRTATDPAQIKDNAPQDKPPEPETTDGASETINWTDLI